MARSLSSVTFGKASMISGHAVRGMRPRRLHMRTLPGGHPMACAMASAPPLSLMNCEVGVVMSNTLLCVTPKIKDEVTPRVAGLASFPAMNTPPDELDELWKRLRWARMRAGFDRAVDAATSLNVKPGTYRSWERRPEDAGREPPLSEIQRMARKFKVSWVWLAAGEGAPDDNGPEHERLTELAKRSRDIDPERANDAWTAVFGVLEAFKRKAG